MSERPVNRPRAVGARRTNRPEIRRRWLLLWGLVLISGSMLASITIHRRQPGGVILLTPDDPVGWAPWSTPSSIPAAGVEFEPLEIPVLLRVSEADRAYLASMGGDYPALIEGTRHRLTELGFEVRETWRLPDEPEDALLCLDYAYCLDAAQWDSLGRWCASGGALLIVGPLAVRDGDGRWIGWDRMLALLGGDAAWEVPTASAHFLTLGRTTPFAPTDLQGARIAFDPGPSSFGVRHPAPLAWWSTHGRAPHAPGPAGDPAAAPESWAGALAGAHGEGRWLWLGFPLEWIHAEPENLALAGEWLRSSLTWLAKDGAAELESWPGGAPSAIMIAEDTETDFVQAEALYHELEARHLRGAFYCVSDLAKRQPDLVRRIAARHEIGSHTDNHQPVGGHPERVQRPRLRRSARDLSSLTGQPVRGFRPPEEQWDETTLRVMVEEGYDYLLGGSQTSRAMPRLVSRRGLVAGGAGDANRKSARAADESALVILPRVARDDYDFAVLRPVPASEVSDTLEAELAIVRRFGGLYLLSLHTHLLGHERSVAAVRPFLDHLADTPDWVVPPGEVASWWRRRASCAVALEPAGDPGAPNEPGTWRLRAWNRGTESIEGLVAAVRPEASGPGGWFEIAAMARDAKPPFAASVRLAADHRGVLRVPLPTLPGGEAVTLSLRRVEPVAAGPTPAPPAPL